VELNAPRSVHLVGIGGAGISAIGIILAAMGHQVTGVDLNETPAWPSLRAAGIEPQVVAADALFSAPATAGAPSPAPALVVAHSTAFPPSPEALAALEARGAVVVDRAGILAAICAARLTVAVSGTHGKTSTTAMLATLLSSAGRDPAYLVGATPVGLDRAAWWSQRSDGAFVVEADESDGTFLRLGATVAVVTNIDEDHLDYWGDIDAIESAFEQFLTSAQVAIVCIDDPRGADGADPRALRVAEAAGALTVGESDRSRYHVHHVQVDRLTTTFGLAFDGNELGPVTIGTPGRHHARNAAVAVAAAVALGVSPADAVRAVSDYRGVARRFEVVGHLGGATVVDDYAHNPGKVRALLASAQEAGWSRVVAVFQPHRYSRTRDLAGDFGEALAVADVVAVTDVYGAGEEPIAGVSGRDLVDEVLDVRPWIEVAWLPTLDDAAAWSRAIARPGDLLLTVGAGDISGLAHVLAEPDG
jgi:UDP-N-acetylmuramate--alanine ligase